MPLPGVIQPDIIQINDNLRLKAYSGDESVALPWYHDPVVYYNSEGVTDPEKIPDENYIHRMYSYLDSHSELYFIEVLKDGEFIPIGDTAVKDENPPIVIGEAAYRGKGLGKLVLETVLSRAKTIGIEKITNTIVYEYNTASKHLHESLGYQCVGREGNELIYEIDLGKIKR